MKVKFDGTLTVSFSGIEIEADNVQEAEEKLCRMDADEIIDGSYIEDLAIDIEKCEAISTTTVVKVSELIFEPNPDLSEEIFAKLPKEVTLAIKDVVYVRGVLSDKLFELFRCKPASYTFKIIAEY